MTTVRLAHMPGSPSDNPLLVGGKGPGLVEEVRAPALLVSYVYVSPFLRQRERMRFRNWALDSGAYSAHKSGTAIDHRKFIDTALRLQAEDPKLVEVFSLDVIGDWEGSLRNVEEEWRQGLKSIPAYHIGEPESHLLHLAKTYPKIALGGVANRSPSLRRRWAHECFARVWPKLIHGFGITDQRTLLELPFHSVDSSSWESGPACFGRWKTYGNLSWRGSEQDIRAEVDWYLRLEDRARRRWRRDLEEVTVRLAANLGGGGCAKRTVEAMA